MLALIMSVGSLYSSSLPPSLPLMPLSSIIFHMNHMSNEKILSKNWNRRWPKLTLIKLDLAMNSRTTMSFTNCESTSIFLKSFTDTKMIPMQKMMKSSQTVIVPIVFAKEIYPLVGTLLPTVLLVIEESTKI